jgi:hypothetical protein
MVEFRLSFVLALGLAVLTLILGLPSSAASQPWPPPDNFANASPLDVVLSEIAWMGTTSSSADEWIELYNNTGSPVDLTGWTLNSADGTPSIPLSGSIPAAGYFLLERTDDTTVPDVPADQTYSGGLGNDGENPLLQDAGSNLIDHVDCNSGWFAGHAEARVPMVRAHLTATGSISTSWSHNPRCGTATNSSGISRTCTLTVTHVGSTLDYSVAFNERVTTATSTSEPNAPHPTSPA